MSRRRQIHHNANYLRLNCGGGKNKPHPSIEVAMLIDKRNSPTDEQFREMEERYRNLAPGTDRVLKPTMPESRRRSVHQYGRNQRRTGDHWTTTERATVFFEGGEGRRKLRIRCPRCGRDEQFTEKRVNKLADAVQGLSKAQRYKGLDIAYLSAYLELQ